MWMKKGLPEMPTALEKQTMPSAMHADSSYT
jgi:hypothetical protein